jgi:ribosome-associated toxin RatA of RatAB toxin-antitoxin module|tara:strand:+ start:163 stop:609 length:447 start_codon:yes stop_codon:yes gene_type:complete
MTLLEFSINLPASSASLIKLATDYENLNRFLPNQIRNIEILENNNGKITTKETLLFKSVIEKQFVQKTIHHPIQDKMLISEIIDGPAKNSIIKIIFKQLESGTNVIGIIDLKLGLKYKIFLPIIKKVYKNMITGIMYKINTEALSKEN